MGHFARGCVELLALHGFNGDDLARGADLQLKIGGNVGVGVDSQAGPLFAAIGRHFDFDGILADGQVDGDIEALTVGGDGMHFLRADLGEGDGCARNNRTGSVGDCTVDLAKGCLGVENTRGAEQRHNSCQQSGVAAERDEKSANCLCWRRIQKSVFCG